METQNKCIYYKFIRSTEFTGEVHGIEDVRKLQFNPYKINYKQFIFLNSFLQIFIYSYHYGMKQFWIICRAIQWSTRHTNLSFNITEIKLKKQKQFYKHRYMSLTKLKKFSTRKAFGKVFYFFVIVYLILVFINLTKFQFSPINQLTFIYLKKCYSYLLFSIIGLFKQFYKNIIILIKNLIHLFSIQAY